MFNKFLKSYTNKFVSRWTILIIDLAIVTLSFGFSHLVRFNFDLTAIDGYLGVSQLVLVLSTYLAGFLVFRSYSGIIRHTGIEDAVRLFFATTSATFVLLLINLLTYRFTDDGRGAFTVGLSLLLINYVFSIFALVTSRFLFKAAFITLFEGGRTKVNVLIYGAGKSGTITRNTLMQDDSLQYNVVGYIDDNPSKINKALQGIMVYSPAILERDFVEKYNVQEVIISIQNISSIRKRQIIDLCLAHSIKVKNVPPVHNWINGELSSRQIKDVKIEDLLQREEVVLPQRRDDPPLRHLHCHFHLRLVLRLTHSRGDDRHAEVLRQVPVRRVQLRLVPVCLRHPGPQVVRDPDLRRAPEEAQRVDVALRPARKVLPQHRLHVGVAARSQRRDEEHRLRHLARLRVDDVDAVSAEVDEELLSDAMLLPHRQLQLRRPGRVVQAEGAVLIPVGLPCLVLLPEQLLGDVLLLQLEMHLGPVRRSSVLHHADLGEQHPRQRLVALEFGWERPAQPRDSDARHVALRRRRRDAQAPRDRPR